VSYESGKLLANKVLKSKLEGFYPEVYNWTKYYNPPGVFVMKNSWSSYICVAKDGSVTVDLFSVGPCAYM
jgi:hypothetical protein